MTTPAHLELGVCPSFVGEFESALRELGFDDVTVRARRSTCLGPPSHRETPPRHGATPMDLLCSRPRSDAPPAGQGFELEQCLHLVASESLVTALQRDGAFVVTPGWARHWRARMKAWGFDPEQARALFGESMKELVLLDTGDDPQAATNCADYAAFVGLPWRALPVGLDHLKERLRTIVGAWRLESERKRARTQAQADLRRSAELSMALDLLRELTGSVSEQEVMRRIVDLFSALFAPTEVVYRPIAAGTPGPAVPADAREEVLQRLAAPGPTVETVSRDAFVVRLVTHGEPVAAVWVGGLSFPERREDYLNLSWSMVELCGMAVMSARNRVRQRAVELELRQAQKLESVGRLASGIAHEINTPTQFVGDSVSFVQEAWTNVVRVLDAAEALCAGVETGTAGPEDARRLRALKEEIDLGFVRQNTPRALQQALDGLERIATIVRSMREFAHPAGSDKECADLNHALETTLAIARHEYKYVADVELQLGELPLVSCFPAELNQVFLNLLVNAAHAIKETVGESGARGRITVCSFTEGQSAVITIRDTGQGIAPEVSEHVFEQFFTTKEVGRGTGQGLAIAWRVVVERHGGTLSFETEVGVGTTFTVRIPLNAKVSSVLSEEPAQAA